MKKALVGIGILLILLFVALLVAPFLVDLNSHKPALLAQLKPYIDRTIDFDRIELSILTGLGVDLQGLRISDDPSFSSEDFLTLKRLEVRCRLLPLLRKRVEIRGVLLSEPTVRIVRNEQGRFNFESLAPSSAHGVSPERSSPPVEKRPGGSLEALAALAMEELEVESGKVVFTDRFHGTGGMPVSVDRIELKVEDVSLDRPVSVRLSAELLGQGKKNLLFDGRLGPLGRKPEIEAIPIQARISIEGIPLKPLLGLSRLSLPMGVREGNLDLSVTANGSRREGLAAQGEISAKGLVLEEREGEKGRTGQLDLVVRHKIRALAATGEVTIESLSVGLNGNQIDLEGSVSGLLQKPTWRFKGKGDGLRPNELVALFPMYFGGLPANIRFEGPVSLRWETSGTPESLVLSGVLKFDGLALEIPGQVRKEAGHPARLFWEIEKKGPQVTVQKGGLTIGELEATASGDVWLEKPLRFGVVVQTNSVSLQALGTFLTPLCSYDLQGDLYGRAALRGTADDVSATLQANSDRVAFRIPASARADGGRQGEEGIAGVAEGTRIEAQARKRGQDLAGTADVRVRAADVRSIRAEQILGRFGFQPGLLEVQGLDCKAFGGEVRSSGKVGLADRSWSFQPTVEGVSIAAVLEQLTKYKGLATGKFSAQMKAEGRPGETEGGRIVSAQGTFRVAEGTLENFDLVGNILHSLFGMEGVAQVFAARQTDLAKHGQTRFESLDGSFDLQEQVLMVKANLRNIRTRDSADTDAVLEGKLLLNEQKVDMKGQVVLSAKHSEDLARKVEPLKGLLDAQRRMVLPLTLQGSVSKPLPFLDTQYVAGAMAKYYGRQGLEKLGKELSLPTRQEGEKPVERLLKDLLKK